MPGPENQTIPPSTLSPLDFYLSLLPSLFPLCRPLSLSLSNLFVKQGLNCAHIFILSFGSPL